MNPLSGKNFDSKEAMKFIDEIVNYEIKHSICINCFVEIKGVVNNLEKTDIIKLKKNKIFLQCGHRICAKCFKEYSFCTYYYSNERNTRIVNRATFFCRAHKEECQIYFNDIKRRLQRVNWFDYMEYTNVYGRENDEGRLSPILAKEIRLYLQILF